MEDPQNAADPESRSFLLQAQALIDPDGDGGTRAAPTVTPEEGR